MECSLSVCEKETVAKLIERSENKWDKVLGWSMDCASSDFSVIWLIHPTGFRDPKPSLPASVITGTSLIMPKCFVLERFLQAKKISEKANLVHCATSAVDTALRFPTNDLLEFLGDSWLKFYFSILVMQSEPRIEEEGLISAFRNNLICNFRLTKHAKGTDFHKFIYPTRNILFSPFEDSWNVSFFPYKPTCVKWKVPADVLEAVVGACLLCGGETAPQAILKYVEYPLLPNYEPKEESACERVGIEEAMRRARKSFSEGKWVFSHMDEFSTILKSVRADCFVSADYFGKRPAIVLVQNFPKLEALMSYKFRNHWLLLEALTHSSYIASNGSFWPCKGGSSIQANNYQRLEMLGDAIIGYMVTCIVFSMKEKFNAKSSGGMTEIVAKCVSNSTFAAVAIRKLRLEVHMRYSPIMEFQIEHFAELVRNIEGSAVHGENPPKVIADIFEALVAAIYIDSDYDMTIVCRTFWPLLEEYAMAEEEDEKVEGAKSGDEKEDSSSDSQSKFSIENLESEVQNSISEVEMFLGGLTLDDKPSAFV